MNGIGVRLEILYWGHIGVILLGQAGDSEIFLQSLLKKNSSESPSRTPILPQSNPQSESPNPYPNL